MVLSTRWLFNFEGTALKRVEDDRDTSYCEEYEGSDSLTSRLSVTSSTPSMLAARVCMATQSRLRRASSKTSSQVMIRWPAGMAPHRARSMVVLPD